MKFQLSPAPRKHWPHSRMKLQSTSPERSELSTSLALSKVTLRQALAGGHSRMKGFDTRLQARRELFDYRDPTVSVATRRSPHEFERTNGGPLLWSEEAHVFLSLHSPVDKHSSVGGGLQAAVFFPSSRGGGLQAAVFFPSKNGGLEATATIFRKLFEECFIPL